MQRRIFSTLAMAALATFSVIAQCPGKPPSPPTPAEMVAHKVARLTTLLSLTTAQQTEATTIFTAEQTAAASLMTSMQTARAAVQAAVQKNDLTAIDTQAVQIGGLTTQLVEAQAKADAAFYASLNAEQQTKYNELKSAGIGGFGAGGHGGPGGPGPGHGGPH